MIDIERGALRAELLEAQGQNRRLRDDRDVLLAAAKQALNGINSYTIMPVGGPTFLALQAAITKAQELESA